MYLLQETETPTRDCRNFAGRPQPCGDEQINGDELVWEIRASQKAHLSYWASSVLINTVLCNYLGSWEAGNEQASSSYNPRHT